MKLKGNGGYQIIDFEGQAPNTLDVDFISNAIARGKPLWVNNLVVDGETYSGVANAKKTAEAIILILATLTITIALEDGSTDYTKEMEGHRIDIYVNGDNTVDLSLDDKEVTIDELCEFFEDNGTSILVNGSFGTDQDEVYCKNVPYVYYKDDQGNDAGITATFSVLIEGTTKNVTLFYSINNGSSITIA